MPFSLSVLLHPGTEECALLEVKEILNIKGKMGQAFITFPCSRKEEIIKYLAHAQLPKRILLSLGFFAKAEDVHLPEFSWENIFSSGNSYGLELEHLHDAELRQSLAQKIGKELVTAVQKNCGYTPKFTFKKPDVLFILHHTGKEFVLGIDLSGEMQKRGYRIFTHHASFTGDLGYFLVRKSEFALGEKLLVGWVKDGTLAIEAALFANALPVHKEPFACQKFPLFKDFSFEIKSLQKQSEVKVFSFDVSLQNITAARKNAKLAGAYELIDFQKYSLEELDVKYGEAAFERIIFHLTVKDEPKLNELYYQMKYILKQNGTVLLVTRKQLDLPVPEGFALISVEELIRGESVQKVWVMRKGQS